MTDRQIGYTLGLVYVVALFVLSAVRNKKLSHYQVASVVFGFTGCQNIMPGLRLMQFAFSHDPNVSLPHPLEGLENYLFIAGLVAEIIAAVGIYSAFVLAWKKQ